MNKEEITPEEINNNFIKAINFGELDNLKEEDLKKLEDIFLK
jgi:hypothetical protein